MNIRTEMNYKDGYYKINREERNLAAIFYHSLLQNDNLKIFLDLTGSKFPVVDSEMGVYFEYAYIRDLWNSIETDNSKKRKIIMDLLSPNNREVLEKFSVIEFNKYFGATRSLSNVHIASPSNWSIKYYNQNIVDNEEFLKVCKFKWCFNAKPDIVIHTTHSTAICIEAKYESGEGIYPSNEFEKEIFKQREIEFVGQLSIQKKIMEEILGIKTEYIFLVQKLHNSETHKTLSWKEVFNAFNMENCPFFIKEWIKRL